MSPYRTGLPGGGAAWLWRGLLVTAFVLIAVIIYVGAGLIDDNHRAVDQLRRQNRQLHATNRQIVQTNCLFGKAITSVPPQRTPGQTANQFRESLILEAALLKNLRAEDCSVVAHGQVTQGEIRSGLRRIHHAQHAAGFAPSGGGSATGPPSASPPGGGTTGGSPGPSPSPPPTHTVTTPAPPPPAPPPAPAPPPILSTPPINACTQKPLPPACLHVPPIGVP